MNNNENGTDLNKLTPQHQSELHQTISKIKERHLQQISPIILIKPALFSFLVLIGSIFIDISAIPVLGNVTNGIAKALYPSWEPAAKTVEPIQFWWLPIISYLFFIMIAIKEFKGLFSHVRNTTPRENIDRIISSSISLIDGYATALPLVGAAFLLVSVKLGPEIFLGLSVPFEIKALIVLAIAKLFEPVLDYIGVKFQKILNTVADYKDEYYQKLQVEKTEELIQRISNQNQQSSKDLHLSIDDIKIYREELEKIKKISFETYQNFTVLTKLTHQFGSSLESNNAYIENLNDLSRNLDSMASNLNNDEVTKSLTSLEHIVNRR